jgi:GT2 family glycosyltransferase
MITVIIVTKDRPEELAITMKSVMSQTLLPDRIVVIDDSDPCLNPSSGIPEARNRGIRHALPGIVLFIDDDVTLDCRYIETVSRFMQDHPDVSGVTGWVNTKYHRENILKRLLRVCIGAILPSLVPASVFIPKIAWNGQNQYPVFRVPDTDSVPAEWLSGCNMAYRSSVFDEGYRFDETMKGYALGEDRVFSNRLYHDGKQLRLVYGARLIHRRHP